MRWTDVRWTGGEAQATLRVVGRVPMGIVWTLRARGLAPSLGAGGSLVVAVLCCLIFATAVLTFRDWPGRGDASPDGTITMPAPPAKAAGRAASGPSAPAAVRRGRRAGRDSAPPRPRPAAPRRAAPRRRAPAPGGHQPARAPPAPAPAAAAPVASQPAASAPHGAPPVLARPAAGPRPGPVEDDRGHVRGRDRAAAPARRGGAGPARARHGAAGRPHGRRDAAGPLLPTLP